jgi:hypothetical protein
MFGFSILFSRPSSGSLSDVMFGSFGFHPLLSGCDAALAFGVASSSRRLLPTGSRWNRSPVRLRIWRRYVPQVRPARRVCVQFSALFSEAFFLFAFGPISDDQPAESTATAFFLLGLL